MFEFALHMPDWPTHRIIVTVKVVDGHNAFLSEAILLGYHPDKVHVERRGVTFNTECSQTGAKHAIILFNANELDIELIVHEVRHAYFWACANHHGAVKVNVLNELEEEAFCRRLDLLINRAKETIEALLGRPLVWKGHHE